MTGKNISLVPVGNSENAMIVLPMGELVDGELAYAGDKAAAVLMKYGKSTIQDCSIKNPIFNVSDRREGVMFAKPKYAGYKRKFSTMAESPILSRYGVVGSVEITSERSNGKKKIYGRLSSVVRIPQRVLETVKNLLSDEDYKDFVSNFFGPWKPDESFEDIDLKAAKEDFGELPPFVCDTYSIVIVNDDAESIFPNDGIGFYSIEDEYIGVDQRSIPVNSKIESYREKNIKFIKAFDSTMDGLMGVELKSEEEKKAYYAAMLSGDISFGPKRKVSFKPF
jgi:hypothetical protein